MRQHHNAFDTNEFEQLNGLNELVTRIRTDDVRSVSDFILTKETESKNWSIPVNINILKVTLISVFMVIISTSVIIIAIKLSDYCKTQERTNFALQLQAWRIKLQRQKQRNDSTPHDIELDQ